MGQFKRQVNAAVAKHCADYAKTPFLHQQFSFSPLHWDDGKSLFTATAIQLPLKCFALAGFVFITPHACQSTSLCLGWLGVSSSASTLAMQ